MTNIWGFLMQTIEISIVALILLLLKKIFQDKLSPRWQYGVWSVLFLSLIIPVGFFPFALFPSLHVLLEAVKTIIEQSLHSSYIDIYLPIKNITSFPLVTGIPHSVTDFLFVFYVLGVLYHLIRYMHQYIQLKKIIFIYGQKPSDELFQKIQQIETKYHFPSCQALVLEGIPSAFVFGLFKPVFVLPKQDTLDEKIILHELLHLQYKDSLQCVIWSCLRCIHWCNPFLQYVFDQIHNDMESLCDQRVLEKLDGEQRRDYGRILLNMTNEKYPYAFGTTSLSNGAKNIKKRIEAIVRFKKYPQGMTVVSLCICLLLAPLSIGYFHSYTLIGNPYEHESFSYQLSLASARMMEYPTIAGAIDTYAKGIVSNDEQFLLSVLPQQDYHDFRSVLSQRPDPVVSNLTYYLYDVIHLEKINDHEYHAKLCFYNKNENIDEKNNRVIAHYNIIPIQIKKERGWKVRQNGQVLTGDATHLRTFMNSEIYDIPIYKIISLPCQSGKATVIVRNGYQVFGNDIMNTPSLHAFKLRPQAKFNSGYQYLEVIYQNQQSFHHQDKIEYISMNLKNLNNQDEDVHFEKHDNFSDYGLYYQSSSNEETFFFAKVENHTLDKEYRFQHISYYHESDRIHLPETYALQIDINGTTEMIKINMEDGEWYDI